MYASFFGLKQEPFSIAPDPRYLFMSERHREALAHLLYGVGGGGGFVLLTGEIGAGKTTVCRCFLEQIPARCNVAYIFNPKLTVTELLRSVCEEFAIPHRPAAPGDGSAPETVKDYVDPLNEYLLRTHAVNQSNVLIIDEAQNLSADVLEQLRLLTNLETNERKLLQIVLIGQPELREMLARPQLEQLAQRVIARFHLQALSDSETGQYIAHRLAVAGLSGANPFDRKSVDRIHQLTRGVPRRINLLCDRALLGAYAGGLARVSPAIVDKAAREVFDRVPVPPSRSVGPPLGWLSAGIAGVALLGLVAWAAVGPDRRTGTGSARTDARTGSAALAGGPVARQAASASMGASAAALAAAPPSAPASGPTSAPASMAASAAASAGFPTAMPAQAAGMAAAPGSPSAASAASASAPPLFDLQAGFEQLPRESRDAWRSLAPLWGVSVPDGDPCEVVARAGLLCDSHANSLALLRLLGRPGLLTLQDERGRVAYALLTGLGPQTATLRIAGVDRRVSLVALAPWWRGEFSTLWRMPPGLNPQRPEAATGPAARWLAQQLQGLQAPAGAGAASQPGAAVSPAALKARIYAFQVEQGLPPDGLAGPFTFMQLNRALGIEEPRLQTLP